MSELRQGDGSAVHIVRQIATLRLKGAPAADSDSDEDTLSLGSASENEEEAGNGGDGGLSMPAIPQAVHAAGNVRDPRTAGPCKQEGGDGEKIECPICQRQWPAASMSNAELNNHVDACLVGM